MAYQPKSYRRFLASSVSAAVVASAAAVVPADVQQADAAESFSDVSNDYWASESIQRLADEGIINGYQDGTYGPGEDINRGQVAELLVNAFDLEVNQDAESSFDDLNDDSYYTPFAEAVEEAGYIQGREDGTMFAAGMDLSREQMATILVRAFNLEPKEDAKANVADLDEANASHQENIEILAQYDITSTENNMFRPKETVNRAQFATFLDRALEVQEPLEIADVSALTGDGHVLSVEFTRPYREDINASDVMIAESDSGERKGVESVNVASDGLSAEITLYDDTSDNADDEIPEGVQHDIQIGDLESTFTRDQFLNDDDNATVTEVNDDDREITVSYNEDNGDGDETTVTLDVPEDSDFNFQQALGHEISVWYDGDNNLTDYELIQHEDTLNTAIEVTENNEIETVEGGDAHDLAEDVTFTVNDGSDDEIVAEGTDEVESEELVGEEYDYAKVIFNDNGDVQRVYAYTFTDDPILTESVDGSIVVGKDDNELDLEDYRVVKDGQQIAAEDIQEGDVVFFNEDAYDGDGFAVVGTNTTSGEIDSIFESSFDVDGTNYDYTNDFGDVQYLDENNEFADLDEDAAEALQDEGNVDLYKNFKGDLVYVTGNVGDIEQTFNASYLQGNASAYVSSTGDTMIELEGINAEGNSYLYDFAPDSLDEITIQNDGETVFETDEVYPEDASDEEIDEFALAIGDQDGNIIDKVDEYTNDDGGISSGPIANQINDDEEIYFVALNNSGDIITDDSDNKQYIVSLSNYAEQFESDNNDGEYTNNIVNVGEDSNENVQDLEFFQENSAELLDSEIDEDDDYANGSLLQDDTLVYDVSDANSDFKDPDEDDVSVTTWGDLKENGVNISAYQAAVYTDEDNYVSHLVTYQDVISSGDEHTALIKDLQTSDGDVVRADVLVNGEERTYDVNDVDPGSIEEGDLVEIEVNDADDLITDLVDLETYGEDNDEDRTVEGTVIEGGVSTGNDEVTVDIDGTEKTFELVNDGQVYDGSDNSSDDYTIENLRDIEDGDTVEIALPSEDSNFADAFVIRGSEDSSNDDNNEDDVDEATLTTPSTVNGNSPIEVALPSDNSDLYVLNVTANDGDSATFTFEETGEVTVDQLTGTDLEAGDVLTVTLEQGSEEIDSASSQITDDTTAPTASISNPGDGSTQSGDIQFTGQATDADSDVASWEITVPNGEESTSTVASGESEVTAGNNFDTEWASGSVEDGEITATLTVTDSEGNESTDEVTFTVDNTAPSFTSSNVTDGTNAGDIDVSGTVDEDGTLYAVAVSQGDAEPTVDQIKNGNDSNGDAAVAANDVSVTADSSATTTLSGTSADTSYTVYYVAEDGNQNASAIQSMDITTATN